MIIMTKNNPSIYCYDKNMFIYLSKSEFRNLGNKICFQLSLNNYLNEQKLFDILNFGVEINKQK